tara:strand:+ start:73 stop:774 length:702 start_codon:yes stop_codon:yes gene_type:complete
MTLLTLAQAACDIIGMPRPTSVMAGADQTARTMLSLAQREGRALARRWTWTALRKQQTFTTVAQTVQTGAVPSDFDRMVSETFWNRTDQERVVGPVTPEEWQGLVASVALPIESAFQMRAGQIELYPVPTAGETYAYEYVSSQWCQSAGGSGQSAWAADTDTGLLDEELTTLGLVWRFKQSRGLDYAEDMTTYEEQVLQAVARDGARRTARLAREIDYGAAHYPMVPEGNWAV